MVRRWAAAGWGRGPKEPSRLQRPPDKTALRAVDGWVRSPRWAMPSLDALAVTETHQNQSGHVDLDDVLPGFRPDVGELFA